MQSTPAPTAASGRAASPPRRALPPENTCPSRHLTAMPAPDHGRLIQSRTSPAMLPARLHPARSRLSIRAAMWLLAATCFGHASLASSDTQPPAAAEPAPAAAESTASTTADNTSPPSPARAQCLQACSIANGQCNSEVRQARQECSRNAANAGRDPFTQRNDKYAYFCGYFAQPQHCANGACQQRFRGHLNLCLNVMQKNIAAMRHDCFRNERDAQRICRSELRSCEATCPQQ